MKETKNGDLQHSNEFLFSNHTEKPDGDRFALKKTLRDLPKERIRLRHEELEERRRVMRKNMIEDSKQSMYENMEERRRLMNKDLKERRRVMHKMVMEENRRRMYEDLEERRRQIHDAALRAIKNSNQNLTPKDINADVNFDQKPIFDHLLREANPVHEIKDSTENLTAKVAIVVVDFDQMDGFRRLIHDTPLVLDIKDYDQNLIPKDFDVDVDSDQLDSFRRRVDVLNLRFKLSMQSCFLDMDKILSSSEKALEAVRRLRSRIRVLAKTTACGNLLFWLSSVCCSTLVQSYVGHPKAAFVALTLIGTASVCGNALAHSSVKQNLADIEKMVSSYRNQLQSLLVEGLSMDREVRKLFPHGYDAKRLLQIMESKFTFESEDFRRKMVEHLILWSNVEEDRKLSVDKEFLMSVKVFAESPASQMWWIRMKIQNLGKGLCGKEASDLYLRKQSFDEDFRQKMSIFLFPVAGTLVHNPESSSRLRFFLTCAGTLMSGLQLADAVGSKTNPVGGLDVELANELATFKEIWRILKIDYD